MASKSDSIKWDRMDEAATEVLVEFNFTPGLPGRYNGPPEDCYPAEAAEFEILHVWAVNEFGVKVEVTLTDEEYEALDQYLQETFEDDSEGDAADYWYEQSREEY